MSDRVDYLKSPFYDRQKRQGDADARTDEIYRMQQRVKNPGNGKFLQCFPWMEYKYHYARYWVAQYTSFARDRFSKTGWTLFFSSLFLYFVYLLCFIPERERISNEYCKVGAYLMVICSGLATLKNSQIYRQFIEKHSKERNMDKNDKLRQAQLRDKQQIDGLLKCSLREALVREQQRRQLSDRHQQRAPLSSYQLNNRGSTRIPNSYNEDVDLNFKHSTAPSYAPVREEPQRPQMQGPWQPIVGIDTSMWQYDPVRQKNTLRNDFVKGDQRKGDHRDERVQQQVSQAETTLLYHRNFDAKQNNMNATRQLKLQFNTNEENIQQFALRAQYFMLRHQFAILLENYEDAVKNLVEFGNANCKIEFLPETRQFDDLPEPILRILKHQRIGDCLQSQVTQMNISSFVDSVLRQTSYMPLSVRGLEHGKHTQLVKLCQAVSEISAIFASVNKVSHTYKDKEGYVIKRLYQMSQDEKVYREEGFSGQSRIFMPTYEGRPWTLGEFPTDPEIVASVFCALLDYSVKSKRQHLFDTNLPLAQIALFDRKDISLVNRQPSSIFRSHFEVYVGRKAYLCPAGTLNLWISVVWVLAAIEKLYSGTYGTFDCDEGINFVFGERLRPAIQRIEFQSSQ